MKDKILELEKSFFLHQYMNNEKWLNEVLHPDFTECGKSGYLSNKQETIKALMKCTKDRSITIYNYEYVQINTDTFLIHYITQADQKLIYRTSVWINEDHLKLLFHQASELNTVVELRKA